jgi:hypothetical protein
MEDWWYLALLLAYTEKIFKTYCLETAPKYFYKKSMFETLVTEILLIYFY